MAARLNAVTIAHPIFDPIRPWLERLGDDLPSPEALSALAAERGLANARGRPLRFAAPGTLAAGNYELRIHETGVVATRPGNLHDLFNALVWLAFPRTKATLNALHARELARKEVQRSPRRSRLRDALTLFDEGGAIVAVSHAPLEQLVREHRWLELFWQHRDAVLAGMRFCVFGHAVLDQSRDPYPGITCRALFVSVAPALLKAPRRKLVAHLDATASEWFWSRPEMTPKLLPPLPVFGYPGWLENRDRQVFLADERYFRPLHADPPRPGA
ncbi:MAG: DUF3025 domain-containing protein [Betaproteobacteria bacterium]|nr:DUF3025 domain-containing protein [Betaproteobacteria bacterium]